MTTKIKKSQLRAFIKECVRECMQESKPSAKTTIYESAPPGFGPGKVHSDIYNKVKAQYGNDSSKAYATMWSIHNKMNEVADNMIGSEDKPMDEAGLTSEASYKVVSPNQVDTSAENKAREIQTDPKVNEASYKVVAPRQATDAKENKARKIQTEPKVNETAYKVQGPSAKTFKDSPQFPKAVNDPKNR